MNDDPIDFSDMNPTNDDAQFEHIVQRITNAAAPELSRRRLGRSVWGQLFAWRKPVIAFGMAAALVMIGVLQFGGWSDNSEVMADDWSVGLGVPSTMTEWVTADSIPTAAQVLYLGEDR